MLVISSGAARTPGQPGYAGNDPSGANKNYSTGAIPGVPFPFTGCTNMPMPGPLHDSISLNLKMRVPTNAKSFSFNIKFYSFEFPGFICSTFNDLFLARMTPPPAGALPANTNNISFDSTGQPLSVNNALLDVCSPQMAGGKNFLCPAGIGELMGTGYEMHGATTWLQTTAPVTGGFDSQVTIDFGVSDAGDGILASTVLVDNFVWSANSGTLGTGNACKLGGTGTCSQCLQGASLGKGCCATQYNTCLGDAECAKIASCTGFCSGNAACIKSCYDSFLGGQKAYDTVLQCYYATVIPDPKDKGACGVACGFQSP